MSNSATRNTTATHAHAIVWIDHLTAKIFSMGLTGVDSIVVPAHLSSAHLHHKANSIGAGKVESDRAARLAAIPAGESPANRGVQSLL